MRLDARWGLKGEKDADAICKSGPTRGAARREKTQLGIAIYS